MAEGSADLIGGEFAGKVAIVTGAAGGLGTAVVDRLLAGGASVVGEDLDPIPERDAATFVAVYGDAADASVARAGVSAARELFGSVDILVNIAGRFLGKTVTETTDAEWDDLFTANVKSVFVHCREAIPALLEGAPGNIVTVGSIAGIVGLRGQAAYSASKGAVTQLTRQIAIEYAEQGLRANVVAPGAIDTSFVARTRPPSVLEVPPGAKVERMRSVSGSHPLGRIATAGEIADVIAYLASPRAAFITGAVVNADGGYTAR